MLLTHKLTTKQPPEFIISALFCAFLKHEANHTSSQKILKFIINFTGLKTLSTLITKNKFYLRNDLHDHIMYRDIVQ